MAEGGSASGDNQFFFLVNVCRKRLLPAAAVKSVGRSVIPKQTVRRSPSKV
jgi:hypothetical protein